MAEIYDDACDSEGFRRPDFIAVVQLLDALADFIETRGPLGVVIGVEPLLLESVIFLLERFELGLLVVGRRFQLRMQDLDFDFSW